jgi:NAD(P)-dependent dehydrogenase (short-subunit alcohol dehydrogenase family)
VTLLAGRVAIVTGAANGLGRAIADGLHRAGASLALVDIDADGLERASGELRGEGAEVEPIVADLADPDQVRAIPEAVVARFGRIDILVNNAGVRDVYSVEDLPLDRWQRTFDINLTAPFLLSQGAAPYMRRQGKGRIVNIASIAAELAFKDRSAYNASKAGVVALTKSLTLELAGDGICCNAIAPGIIETSLNRHYFAQEPLRSTIVANTPAGRWGQPPEIAGPVVFLCTDEASFVNGVTIPVDGGWLAGKGY